MNFYNIIRSFLNNSFTARDMGNGFGYDMYHQGVLNNYLHEYLIEVKTTANLNDNDYFKLSNNEFNKMVDCSNLIFSHYYISRMFFDSVHNVISKYNVLEFNKSNGTLCWYDNSDVVMYELKNNDLDNEHKFVRYQPSKTLHR